MPVTPQQLCELEAYAGTNPIPADFDAFWAERVAEADERPLDFETVPADVPSFDGCEYLDLWFRGMAGARLYAKYLRPAGPGPAPLVLQFHGYPGRTRSWFEHSSFVGMGFAGIALDNPGQGGRSEDVGGFRGATVSGHLIAGLGGDPKDLYYVRLYQDIRILCRIVRELPGLDLDDVCVYGGSQGGAVGLATCALNGDLIRRAAILYPFLSDFRGVWERGDDVSAYEGLRYFSRWFDADGSGADEWFRRLGYIDTLSFAHLVRCEVLFGTGLADDVCPPPRSSPCTTLCAAPRPTSSTPTSAMRRSRRSTTPSSASSGRGRASHGDARPDPGRPRRIPRRDEATRRLRRALGRTCGACRRAARGHGG